MEIGIWFLVYGLWTTGDGKTGDIEIMRFGPIFITGCQVLCLALKNLERSMI